MTEKKSDEADIFNVARKIDALEARAEYLNLACGDDAQLRGRIEQLLQALARQPEFLSSPPAEIAPTVDQSPIEHLAKPGNRIGPYRLLEKIGEGGMGTVFMANQERPVQRRVALKIIKPGRESEGTMARFEAERQALAMMDHPHIARVLDAGTTEDDRPYFVMELVKGVPITKYCDDNRLSLNDRLKLFLDVCNAVQHAHQKGVIHRDLKPTNILVAEYDDKAVPKVIDFGLAKALGQQLTEKTMFTGFGEIMGTLEYMSPEQAKFNQLDIDTRSDIYSLGVLLYELVTGSTPFDQSRLRKAALDEAVRIIRAEEPPRPSLRLSSIATLADVAAQRRIEPGKLRSLVRGELDWIVMKTLDKERTRRYQTSAALADDVNRYLTDQRVIARPPTTGYLLQKFVRRNRIVIGVASVLFASLVIGLSGTFLNWRKAVEALDQLSVKNLELEQKQASLKVTTVELQAEKESLRRTRYLSDMAAANEAVTRGEFSFAIELLERNKPESGKEDLRGIEWDYLWNKTHPKYTPGKIPFETGPVSLAISPNKKILAVSDRSGAISFLNSRTREIALPSISSKFEENLSAPRHRMSFSPDSQTFAYVSGNVETTTKILETGTQLIREFPTNSAVGAIAFSPVENILALFVWEDLSKTKGTIELREVESNMLLKSCEVNFFPAELEFSPDGRFISIAGSRRGAFVWDHKAQDQPHELGGVIQTNTAIAFSPDGVWLAAAFSDGVVQLHRRILEKYEFAATYRENSASVRTASFSQNGALLGLTFADGTMCSVDLNTLRTKHLVSGYGVSDMLFVDDGRTVITCGDTMLCVWSLAELEPYRKMNTNGIARDMVFASENELIYIGEKTDEVRRLRISSFEDEVICKTQQFLYAAALSCNGILATAGDNHVQLWKLSSPQSPILTHHFEGRILALQFAENGRQLAAATSKGLVVWEVTEVGQVVELLRKEKHRGTVAISGDFVASGSADGTVEIWRWSTGELIASSRAHRFALPGLDFSADGKSLLSSANDGTVRIYSTLTGKVLRSATGFSVGTYSNFQISSNYLATTDFNGVTLREENTLDPRFHFPRLPNRAHKVKISPAKRWMAISVYPGVMQIWDMHSNR